jgi:DNA-binding transcriptional MerR regulator
MTVDCSEESDEEWRLRPRDVAAMFGVGVESVAEWSDRGLLPCRRALGGHRRYRPTQRTSVFCSIVKQA